MRILVICAALVACGGGSGTIDGGPSDGAPPLDGSDPAVDCPNRTAAVGQPQTTPGAGEVALGDVTVRTALDVAGLAGKKVITGSLTIDTAELATVALPDLEVVQGSIEIRGAASTPLEVVELPHLETVGGFVQGSVVANAKAYRMPRLETLGRFLLLKAGELDVRCLRRTEGATELDRQIRLFGHTGTTLSLSRLERADLEIGGMPNLTALDLPRLTSGSIETGASTQPTPALTSIAAPLHMGGPYFIVGVAPQLTSITFHANAAFESVTMRSVGITSLAWLAPMTVTYLTMSHADALPSLAGMPASVRDLSLLDNAQLSDVTALGAKQSLISLTVLRNPALVSLELATLTSVETDVRISGNTGLTRVVAPLLTTVGTGVDDESQFENNPALPTACATAIRDHVLLTVPAAKFRIAGNGTGACP